MNAKIRENQENLINAILSSNPKAFSEYNVKVLKGQIEKKSIDSAFWGTFDAYVQVVGTPEWEKAIEKLPAVLQGMAQDEGFDCILDWDHWGSRSFFSLSFEDEESSDYLNEENEDSYIECLNEIEEAMWVKVQADCEYNDFVQAMKDAI